MSCAYRENTSRSPGTSVEVIGEDSSQQETANATGEHGEALTPQSSSEVHDTDKGVYVLND